MTGPSDRQGAPAIDPELLAILACPAEHHAPLELGTDGGELLCTECDRAFPIRNGIPVLLLDEARHREG